MIGAGGGGPGGGSGGGGEQQNLLSIAEAQNAQHRMEQQQHPGMWPGQLPPGCENMHQLQQQLQHQQQQQLQQQQINMLMGQHGNLAPLVGQQISQISSMLPVGSSHQSPPTLNMMLSGATNMALFQNHGGMAGQVQSPPSSAHQGSGQGGYLLLGTTPQPGQHSSREQQVGGGGMPPALSPNSNQGGIQMPGPPATPPIVGVDLGGTDRNVYMGNIGRMIQPGMDKFGVEVTGIDENQQPMAWKGGVLADIIPTIDQRSTIHQQFDPRMATPGGNQNLNPAAMAQLQAQENMVRLHNQQQQPPPHKPYHGQQQLHPPHIQQMYHQHNDGRAFPHHIMPAQSPPAPNNHPPYSQSSGGGPPGPRPRPVGGDDTSPGFTPEVPTSSENANIDPPTSKDDLVIGSWNDDCEKEAAATVANGGQAPAHPPPPPPTHIQPPTGPPPNIVHNLNQPPPNAQPRRSPEALFGGTFNAGNMSGGNRNTGTSSWNKNRPPPGPNQGRKDDQGSSTDFDSRGRMDPRGGSNTRGGRSDQFGNRDDSKDAASRGNSLALRGRGSLLQRGPMALRGMRGGNLRAVDHTQEKKDGKSAAIEETKALMAKMRLEEKEAMDKYRKEKGIFSPNGDETNAEEDKNKKETTETVQPGAYRPKEKRGAREERKEVAPRPARGGGPPRPDNNPPPGPPVGRGGLPRGGRVAIGIGPGYLPPHLQQGSGGGGPSGNMPLFGHPHHPGANMPGLNSDFRTPPFPGLEGFLSHQAPVGPYPHGFPPHNLGPGFQHKMFPGGFPGAAVIRNRGLPRGPRGFPAGFPPRGFPHSLLQAQASGLLGANRGGGMNPRGRGIGRGTKNASEGGGYPGKKDKTSSNAEDGGSRGTANDGEDTKEGNASDDDGIDNPLMNAIKPGKEAENADGKAKSEAEPPKNLFSEQGTNKGQLALLASADLKVKLSDQLVRGQAECMVCLDRVKQHQATWDCHNCYQVFHFHCIKKWAKSAQEDSGGWRCPGCQGVTDLIPREYRCFCRKLKNPEWSRNEGGIPHSCGEVCGRKRGGVCRHTCTDLCHPGPCPPCLATILQACPCGNVRKRVRCGDEVTCENVCGKVLNCGLHNCTDICHQGDCDECTQIVSQDCFCTKENREVECTVENAGVTHYSCGQPCELSLDCQQHNCDAVCHSGPCDPCQLTPEKVKNCPCGKQTLESLYQRDKLEPRKSCSDEIPTCGAICDGELPCGPASQHHTCAVPCHTGPCPVCTKTTNIRCRCGTMEKELACSQIVDEGANVTCEKRCPKKRGCGRHKCGQLCCIDFDHVCPLICGRLLSCSNHRCEDLCHTGNCKTCPRVSFEELTCTCGVTVTYPPIQCGTKAPECKETCSRRHQCEHPILHNCHSEENCPPCTFLTTKKCLGGHEDRKNVACHVEGISCGKPCARPLTCGRHKCVRICHEGKCQQSGAPSCTQPCAKPRPCGHPCAQACHEGACPETSCSTQVKVSCECGHRQTTMQCSENNFSRITTAVLATRMAQVQAGNSINLKELSRKEKKLECTEECSQLERNKRVALALQIRNPELSSKITPRYSDFLKDWVKKDPNFCNTIHDELTKLVQLAKESKQKSRLKSFDCMNREKRQLVHEYAQHFGCETESCDAEPKRNVVATAFRERSWLPAVSLVDFVQKRKKITVPTKSTEAASSMFTSLSKPSAANSLTSTTALETTAASQPPKIDWFG